ncbi:MAG TPA: hypothetical protein VGH47_00140 [Xanthobacteraceae bacterium]|jgi:hypothetical protein
MTDDAITESYLGDGLYARYDGIALWLRAPREHGDHEVALEPQVLAEFLRFAFKHEIPRRVLVQLARNMADGGDA